MKKKRERLNRMENQRKRGRVTGRLLRFAVMAMSLLLLLGASLTAQAASDDAMSQGERFRYEGLRLCPGGFAFGVKFNTRGVLVVGLSPYESGGKPISPAKEAGLRPKDVILSIDGKEVNSASEIAKMFETGEGKAVTVTFLRDGKEKTATLTPLPADSDGVYKAGMWLRDHTAGIGTVTFVEPESGAYGGLGHGICDMDTGALMPIRRGSAMKVRIGGVVKGRSGKPGEIKGYFLADRCGNVIANTLCGVFGVFSETPDLGEPIEVASRYELKEGKATILCTLGDDGVKEYEIEISKIDRNGTDNKNFVITVTDSVLKERTGGIVQGMSGSPIIQNGKLVGAVTHVMVNDPAVGYGIFIENMLDQMGDLAS